MNIQAITPEDIAEIERDLQEIIEKCSDMGLPSLILLGVLEAMKHEILLSEDLQIDNSTEIKALSLEFSPNGDPSKLKGQALNHV